MSSLTKTSKIYVAGHKGLVGSSIVKLLNAEGYKRIVVRTKDELDLRIQSDVRHFFLEERPEFVFVAAARVGGIYANNHYRAQFLYDNLMIAANIIHSAYESGCSKLLYLGSSCIYPKNAKQPIKEKYLLQGILEETNEPYALAKIAGLKLCENFNRQYGTKFIAAMPTNLYGINDNFHPENSHVLPALIRKFHFAKISNEPSVTIWGTGAPLREFLYVDDLAEALLHLMSKYESNKIINIGTGEDISIKELAHMIKRAVQYEGGIFFDTSKPDGTMKKQLDVTKINQLGWKAMTKLADGIELTYEWYRNNYDG